MKLRKNSIGRKLWNYFALFAMVTLLLLWLLQTVFLQSFYDRMQLGRVKRAAGEIAEGVENGGEFRFIDRIAYENSMQVILTDENGNIWYRADEYSSTESSTERGGQNPYWNDQNPYRADEKPSWQIGKEQYLPEEYPAFLERLTESAGDEVSYELTSDAGGRNLIYGKMLSGPEETLILYINTPIGAVQPTVQILRTMLLAVTGVSLLLGLALAYFFARRFAKPVAALSAQAREMAEGKEDIAFERGFCDELDELSETLETTAGSLAKLEHSRRELLANITHDLRTPLTLISGYAEKIEDLSWEDREEARTDAAVIQREAKRLTLLVNDILDYSALQSGGAAFEFHPVNLSELAEKVLGQFQVLSEQKNLTFERRIEPGLYVTADEQRISQVFYNLTANAVTHVGEDKVIGLRVYRNGNMVRTEVYDHGSGIASEELPHIWDRYFTSRQRRRSEHGTGLGLSIVKEILTAHKARYGVESGEEKEGGRGSLFWFELEECTVTERS